MVAAGSNKTFALLFAQPAGAGSNASAAVLVAWCVDMASLPCPLSLRSPPGVRAWTTLDCWARSDFVGEALDEVCAGSDGLLQMYTDNAPIYLTLKWFDKAFNV